MKSARRNIPARCNLCGHDDSVVISRLGVPFYLPVRNVVCKRCGLVYRDPIPGPQQLADFYYNYRKKTINLEEPTPEYEEYARRMAYYHYSFFREYCRPGMAILDIGCGAGTLLSHAVQDHLIAYGVNPDPGFGNYGLKHYGLKEVQICLFEQASFPSAMFDIITCNHVFEHLVDPTAALMRIRKYLKTNGLIYFSIPNVLSPHGQLEYNFFWEHITNFSPTTITLLLKKMGFKIIKISTYGYETADGLHHPYIDLVARKEELETPCLIDWSVEGERWVDIDTFLKHYRNDFFVKHNVVRCYLGLAFFALNYYIKDKAPLLRTYNLLKNALIRILGISKERYVHTEPDYCTRPMVLEFPADRCIYYQ
ncbi:MAG TPA: class I SAM-dependent methyltransferase [Syntrophales bacterium]|nr:class I SAM-dependent methyltransferase [Syntrophales bacterium]